MKHYLPKNTEDGAALIITLLIVVLLVTISVSFFSTTRTEQTATRNYTSKTQAEQFATMATQQAMAKIQQGFTVNATGTTVITTQPGAIRQFVFQNGNITSNATTNLFSENGSGNTANLNNLENPSSNSTATSNQFTITGNQSQQLNVAMENVTTTVNGNTQVLGRIAYYVDDELTKLNINAATANRPTLNVADSRTLSLTTLSNNTTTLGNFQNTINGTTSSASDLANWGYFFRPEQTTATGNNTLNLSPSRDLPYLTALPPSDFHMKYTPWGARRLFINDTAEVPLNSTGVDKIVAALSDPHLRNIYGRTFADKYTSTGLKQIAANMLQRKSSITRHHNNSYAYAGSLIGGDNLDSDGIPREYLGQASFPGLNEVGISARLAVELTGGNIRMRNILQVCIETLGWETGGNSTTSNSTGRIIVDLDSLTYDVNYSTTSNGSTTNSTISLGGIWPVSGTNGLFNQFCTNSASTYTQNFCWEDPNDWRKKTPAENPPYWSLNATLPRNSGNPSLSSIYNGHSYRYHIGTLGRTGRGGEISMGFSFPASSNIRINSISNIQARIKKIRLLSNYNDPSTIRDWVVAGKDVGDFLITLSTANLTGFAFPFTANSSTTINPTWADPEPIPAPSRSYGRLDPRLKSVSSLLDLNPWPSYSNTASFAWGPYGNSTWGSNGTLNQRQGYGYLGQFDPIHGEANNTGSLRLFTSNSSWTRNNLIPGDPLPNTWRSEAIFDHFIHNRGAWFINDTGVTRWPYFYSGIQGWDPGFQFLDASRNNLFIAPRDLGTVATNYPWRTLRMQVQPRNEVAASDGGGNMTTQSLIPDWAMLDVISFGMNSTTIPLNFSSHVNLNNKFATSNGTLTSNRSKSLESLLESFDNANSNDCQIFRNPYGLSGNYALANVPDMICYEQLSNATSAAGLANGSTWSQLLTRNIGNITWSPLSYWGSNNTATNRVRKSKGFPANQIVLPSEVTEIRDIADLVSTNSTTFQSSTRYTNAARHIKSNELRLSPFFPGATTFSNFFTIYAYAQALDKQGAIDSEVLTKSLVEVEITTAATATTPAQYKVKKLYTQAIPFGG